MGISSIDQRPECMSMNESSVSFYNVPSCFGEISIPFSNSSIKYKSIPVQLIKSIPASESFIYHKMLRIICYPLKYNRDYFIVQDALY